jgi:hypothetical protein
MRVPDDGCRGRAACHLCAGRGVIERRIGGLPQRLCCLCVKTGYLLK